jgi:hypothetical protein
MQVRHYASMSLIAWSFAFVVLLSCYVISALPPPQDRLYTITILPLQSLKKRQLGCSAPPIWVGSGWEWHDPGMEQALQLDKSRQFWQGL